MGAAPRNILLITDDQHRFDFYDNSFVTGMRMSALGRLRFVPPAPDTCGAGIMDHCLAVSTPGPFHWILIVPLSSVV
ncbi:MAG: hypothetical protein ACOCXJ_04545, partial [Planctomycetota bacterium]